MLREVLCVSVRTFLCREAGNQQTDKRILYQEGLSGRFFFGLFE